MTRLLLDRATDTLQPYPRQDDEPVAGLDRNAYQVVEVVREPEPADYDPATHFPAPLEPVVTIDDPDSDDCNGTATYGWGLVAFVPPPPVPDWATFRSGLLISPDVAALMGAARMAGCEPGVTALPVALEKAQQGNPTEFAACWALVVRDGAASAKAIAALVAAATACNLPPDFIAALLPQQP